MRLWAEPDVLIGLRSGSRQAFARKSYDFRYAKSKARWGHRAPPVNLPWIPRDMLTQPKELEGILLVDKPTDHTSHDVIARLRGKLKMKRIGHAGTLDPMATGLLVVLVGKATRVSQYLISLDKEYTGTISLGKVTTTQDAEGEMLETRPVPPFTEAQI